MFCSLFWILYKTSSELSVCAYQWHVVDARGRRYVLIGPIGVLRPFELDLQSLHADLEAVHGLDRSLRRRRVIERHET